MQTRGPPPKGKDKDKGDERLRPWIDAHALQGKHRLSPVAQALAHSFPGRQLPQQGIVDDEVKAGIAACHRRHPDPALALVGLEVGGGDGVGHPLSIGAHPWFREPLDREIIVDRDRPFSCRAPLS